ncbi:hypothetical protein DU504_07240 [Haloplanus salinus]|uniref:Uncharacterized protein n=1 Tax=Haloplanus salinus TaxID=1126245 RepID=A0A368NCA3_9EURY|nr:hypothetical protein [Haloplanus salinus]RCU47111.1 hypothetical protein DU504_07240 [Haloplanus salinus]
MDDPASDQRLDGGGQGRTRTNEVELELDARERIPVERWRRAGRIVPIRRRVRRIAIGSGLLFVVLTLVPSDGDWSVLVSVARLLSLVAGIGAWSVSEALAGVTGDDGDGGVLAVLGTVVLVALAWSADRSGAGTLLWRALLGSVSARADDREGAATGDVTSGATGDVTATRPTSAVVGVLTAFLAGGGVLVALRPQGGGGVGTFVVGAVVVGVLVGLLAAVSWR